MFENVALKIQKAAKIIWIVGLVILTISSFAAMIYLVSVFAQFSSDVAEVLLLVFCVMIGCIIVFCISTLWLYFITLCIKGFGQLIENTDKLVEKKPTEEEEEFIAFNK